MQHHIFLSYSRKDTDIMRRVRDDLRAAGLTVWTDEELTPGTPSWKSAIEQAIENAACVVVLMSPDAKGSQWIERELDYARTRDLPIFPVLARGDERDAIPLVLINVEWADIKTDYASGIGQLTSAVSSYVQTGARPGSSDRMRDSAGAHLALPLDNQQLDPWNLFDQFRLLWWLFLTPGQLVAFRTRAGNEPIRKTGFWLVSSLAWFPIVLPIIGYALGTVQMPNSPGTLRVSLLVVGLLLIIGWALPGWMGRRSDYATTVLAFIVASVTAFGAIAILSVLHGVVFAEEGGVAGTAHTILIGMALGIAFGVAFAVASGAIGIASGILVSTIVFGAVFNKLPGIAGGIAGITMAVVTFGVVTSLQRNMRDGRLSRLSQAVAAVAALTYTVMIWVYLLGGWQVLRGLQAGNR